VAQDLEGGCACATVRYRLVSSPMFVHCCHCRDCQRQTGSAFVLNALIETDRVAAQAPASQANLQSAPRVAPVLVCQAGKSLSFSRKTGSYFPRPRLRSQTTTSMGSPKLRVAAHHHASPGACPGGPADFNDPAIAA
jgi:hypothetical protein